MKFLGHKCTDQGILPDDNKIKVIKNYPRPTDKDATRRLVAFANYYRRFIKNFASMAQPLNGLTKKNVDFIWSDECEEAFQTIINTLSSPPILKYPDFKKEFIVTVDASKSACGAVLSQKFNGNDLPIYYASKSFTKGELNKSTIEKELLAIHFAIKQFRPYIYGTKFTVRSDHKPLVYLFKMKDPSSKLTRIRLDLEEYNFIIEHIKGKDNVAADALSRISIEDIKNVCSYSMANVTTRSMKEKKVGKNAQIEEKIEEKEPKVIEELGVGYQKAIPRIRSRNLSGNIENLSKNPGKSVIMYEKHRKICQLGH